jgi:CheY-like chemotaxis protein
MSTMWQNLRTLLFGEPAEEKQAKAQADQRARRQESTILVIDDDPAFLQVLRPVLQEEGYNVLTSSSGPKGLNMLRYGAGNISVVLLDFSMPTLDGAETLRFVRQLNAATKVIAVTGLEEKTLPQEFREGVDAFLQKPFPMGDLTALISRMLEPKSNPPA